MRLALILAAFFIASSGCNNCDCDEIIKLSNPDITKPPERRETVNLVVKIDKDDKIYIEDREIPLTTLDATLKNVAQSKRVPDKDLTIVIDADSSASYRTVFRLMRTAKKDSLRVTARIADVEN